MKDTRNILLLLLSFGLVGTWVYHVYEKMKVSRNTVKPVEQNQDRIQIKKAENDSLRVMYDKSLNDLGTANIDKDLLSATLKEKVNEIDSLRNEIAMILNDAGATKDDLRRAEQKIIELKQKMLAAGESGISYSKQVQRPANIISNQKPLVPVDNTPEIQKKQIPSSDLNKPVTFTASDISIQALQDQNAATTNAARVDCFQVSCMLRNSKSSFSNTDLYVVITDPSGKTIQDDEWQSGVFAIETGAMLPYTRKNSLVYNKGETKRITINVKMPGLNPGAYGVQLYHNGSRIGKADIRLN